jgi:hypothetical protein
MWTSLVSMQGLSINFALIADLRTYEIQAACVKESSKLLRGVLAGREPLLAEFDSLAFR